MRHPASPVITTAQIHSRDPRIVDPSSVFNPGGIRHQGQTLLLLRVQNRGRQTFLLKARSSDGIHFDISEQPVNYHGLSRFPYQIHHIYDPRIVYLQERFLITCAIDSSAGCYAVIFESRDLQELHYMGMISDMEQRNAVLFPEPINGKYMLLSRPNEHTGADGVKSGTRILCYSSSDLQDWQEEGVLMQGRPHFWDELIGSGPPPLKTPWGWLHIYHGVATHFGGGGIYQAGISLLDLHEPWKLIARGHYNVIEPRQPYEISGQVPNVIFPTVAIPMQEPITADTPIYIYYGAADSCIGLEVTSPRELFRYGGISEKELAL